MSIRCDGARTGFSLRCNASLYRCTHCGTAGCTQNKPGICSNQGFEVNEKCIKCGTIGQRKLSARKGGLLQHANARPQLSGE